MSKNMQKSSKKIPTWPHHVPWILTQSMPKASIGRDFLGTGQTFKNVQQSTTAIPTWLHHGTQGLPYGTVSSATSAVSQRFSQPASKNTMHAVSKLNMTMRIQSGSLCRSGNRAFTANRPIRQFFPIGKSGICVGMGSNRAIGCFLRIGQPGFYNHSDNCFWIGQVVPIGQLPQSGIGCHSCNPCQSEANRAGGPNRAKRHPAEMCCMLLKCAMTWEGRFFVTQQRWSGLSIHKWSKLLLLSLFILWPTSYKDYSAFFLAANELQGLFRFFFAANELQGLIRFYIERARQLYTRHRKKSVTFSKLPSESMRVQLPCTSHSQWTDEEENPFEMPIVTRIAMKSCKQVAPVISFAIAAVQMH